MKITELVEGIVDEISLGDYTRKAKLDQAGRSMSMAFGHDQSPETKAKHTHKINKREQGLARAKARSDKWAADRAAKAKADHEHSIRSKYAGVDIDAEIAKLKPAMQRAYHDYQYGARNTYSQAHDEYSRLAGKIRELENAKKVLGELNENATPGATMAANIGTVANPQLSPGKARGKKSYTGSPGKSGTKAPPQPKVKQPKNSDGTAKNGLDMKTNIFGGGAVKR
jgi:hypothetical protein